MRGILIGYWRGYKCVNASGIETAYTDDYGPLFKINADRTVEYSYRHEGKWGDVSALKLELTGTKEVIKAGMEEYFVKSVTETELILVVGKYQADFTFYLKRIKN